ncbi:G-protein coupled receptor, putative [Hepatocystis sp. ex Piliocolobus tephrosceles]|nr:G-protein coupled receptor, putative [Hepatocystis sp. ex Piliocolobus tephrosceles]
MENLNNKRYISNELLEEFNESLQNIQLIKEKLNEYSFKLNSDIYKQSSQSVYCGVGGILYMNIVLYECIKDYTYLELGKNIVNIIDKYKRRDSISFLEGSTGIYSLSCVLHFYLENNKSMTDNMEQLIMELKENENILIQCDSNCELLYGKCGYIYSFLFCKNIWMGIKKYKYTILKNLYDIMNAIFTYGLSKANEKMDITSLSLFYQWHKQIYLGAAHGYAGIFFILFKLILFFQTNLEDLCIALVLKNNSSNMYEYQNIEYDLNSEELEQCKASTMQQLNEYIKLIYKVTDEILITQTNKEYNVYSSIKKDKHQKKNDSLVQWCHGNIGFIILLIDLLKYKYAPTYFLKKYNIEYLEKMGDLVWEKGLLYKGFGLCHGIPGNGIVFLYLYNFTNNRVWYVRALKYALFSIKYFKKLCSVPDRPKSLYEGYAGLVVFLCFIINPQSVYFLGYDFPS